MCLIPPCQERLTLIGQLSNFASKDAEPQDGILRLEPTMSMVGQESNSQASGSTTGMETFTLDYKVCSAQQMLLSETRQMGVYDVMR